jgi:hypothetical protein
MAKQISNVSKLLEMAIKRYQFDVVGWTKYCTETSNTERKALPSGPSESLEVLRIHDKLSTLLHTPPVQKIYNSKNTYINWLDKEYERVQAFYEAILKNPGKYEIDSEDESLNEEINHSAKEYLKTIKGRRINEESLINNIPTELWDEIKVSKYPKVMLGLILGASEEDIINNFGLYFINLLKAHFAGGRTAFLSSSGPEYWHELDNCKVELSYFKEEVIRPSLDVINQDKKKK